jgi:hypothetical protein
LGWNCQIWSKSGQLANLTAIEAQDNGLVDLPVAMFEKIISSDKDFFGARQ